MVAARRPGATFGHEADWDRRSVDGLVRCYAVRDVHGAPAACRPAIATAVFLALAGAAAILAAYATVVEPNRLVRTVLRRPSPLVAAPVRLLLVSDLHLHARSAGSFRRLARAAKWAREFGVAGVLLGGDIVELDDEADVVAQRLRGLFGPLPLLAVLGNHETEEADWPLTFGIRAHVNDVALIRDAFDHASIELIDDRATTVAGVRVAGLAWRRGVGPTDSGRRLVGDGDPWPLVLTHSPDQLVGLDAARIGLALCGHTHGGQVRLPLVGTPITHTRTRLTLASGPTRVDGVETFITRGFGQTIPLRFAAPPEVVLLELLPAPAA